MAAAIEIPRRLASSTRRALTGLLPFRLSDLARAVAEPLLLGQGLKMWDTGHDALLATRLLREVLPEGFTIGPLAHGPVGAALARTLSSLRTAGIEPDAIERIAGRLGATAEDSRRLRWMGLIYRRFNASVEGRFADAAAIFRAAQERVSDTPWLAEAEILVVEDLELDGVEKDFLEALARALPVRLLERERPASLWPSTFAAWAQQRGIRTVSWADSTLAPLDPKQPPPGIRRLRGALFEPPSGERISDRSVELMTASGEAAEVRGIARRLLQEASHGVPFEEMGVILPAPQVYAPLFSDLLERLSIPYRLHPSLPLRFGRAARSLLLLLRCRGLPRIAVMEFLSFAPINFDSLLQTKEPLRRAQWDAITRDAGVVSGWDRWVRGLETYAELEREAAAREDGDRSERRLLRAANAEMLLRVVGLLYTTLEGLSGEASWAEWSERLGAVVEQWIRPERDRPAVASLIADLGALGFAGEKAGWREVEEVLSARLEWERLPLDPIDGGAVHVGAMDAMAGLCFRFLAIPGLVEGGYPGVLRPDPFLLDNEREALASPSRGKPRESRGKRQLSLFGEGDFDSAEGRSTRLPTTQDRLLEARRLFQRAIGQATERLLLSYPRADPRSGRARMPSLFFAAAASALEGRPLSAAELDRLVTEDDLDSMPLEHALDRSERDRMRVRKEGRAAILAIARGSASFKQSHLASAARWSNEFTPFDGLAALPMREEVAGDLKAKLDPVTAAWPLSASRLATYSLCGFLYMLQHVLHLDPVLEPEERRRLNPLERGSLFHEVAEHFLRERRDRGELPLVDTEEVRARLLELADQSLGELVAGSPPRFTVLWERERRRFRETLLQWLSREVVGGKKSTPAYFELSFGLAGTALGGEPGSAEPLEIELDDGRVLRVSGKIDRIDRRPDGALVLRDYKTGKAPPKDEGGIFRGGKQLQIPFYVLAARKLFPDSTVAEAFLDYVDAGRPVNFDPSLATGKEFASVLRKLVDSIAEGNFVQEPTSCDWCDYTEVCGPKPLIERRRRPKLNDPRIQRYLRLRDL